MLDNNTIFIMIRDALDYKNTALVNVFGLVEQEIDTVVIANWLKKESDQQFQKMADKHLTMFLNGLIIEKRGKKEGTAPVVESELTNNIVLRKLKIAYNMKDDDILRTIDSAGKAISKYELSAFFRKKDHRNYRPCKNQVLRNFLKGLSCQ